MNIKDRLHNYLRAKTRQMDLDSRAKTRQMDLELRAKTRQMDLELRALELERSRMRGNRK